MFKKLIKSLINRKTTVLPFKQGLDLTGLPIVTFNQGDKRLNFLLDTGSNNNIIHSKVLDNIDHKLLNKMSDLYGVDGIKKMAEFCDITISYKDIDYEFDYLICDLSESFNNIKQETGVTLHGIIGSNFFQKFQYVLDFAELIAYSKK